MGKKGTPEFLGKDPADLTPLLEEDGLPNGSLWESCATAVPLQQARARQLLPDADPARRAMVDSAMFYVIGTLYPYITRATYPTLHFPQYAGEVGASDADDDAKARAVAAAIEAVAQPLEAFRSFFLAGGPFIGGDAPSIADIRFAASLEFFAGRLSVPRAREEYLSAGRESALGDAYTEPASDVRGYIASVKPEAVGA